MGPLQLLYLIYIRYVPADKPNAPLNKRRTTISFDHPNLLFGIHIHLILSDTDTA